MAQKVEFQGWVSRDETHGAHVYLHEQLPQRIIRDSTSIQPDGKVVENHDRFWMSYGEAYALPKDAFPELTWKDLPVRVDIDITPTV